MSINRIINYFRNIALVIILFSIIVNGSYSAPPAKVEDPKVLSLKNEIEKPSITIERKIKIYFELAETYLNLGDIEQASQYYRKIIENKDAIYELDFLGKSYLRLGYIEIRKGNYYTKNGNISSEYYFSQYINDTRLNDFKDDALIRRGYIQIKKIINEGDKIDELEKKNLLKSAFSDFDNILKRHVGEEHDPFCLEAFFRRATISIELPGLISQEDKYKDIEKLLKEFPSYSEFLNRINRHSDKRFDEIPYDTRLRSLIEALEVFIKITDKDTHIQTRRLRAEVALWIANLYYELSVYKSKGDFSKSLKYSDKVFEIAKGKELNWRVSAGAHALKADCYMNRGEYQKAIDEGLQAEQLITNHIATLDNYKQAISNGIKVEELIKKFLAERLIDRKDATIIIYTKIITATALLKSGEKQNVNKALLLFKECHDIYSPFFDEIKYRNDYLLALNDLWYARCLKMLGDIKTAKQILLGIINNPIFRNQLSMIQIATSMHRSF